MRPQPIEKLELSGPHRPLMRAAPWVPVLVLLAPTALANHAVYLERDRVLDCLVRVQVSGVDVGLNCPNVQETVLAAEAAGGQYRLTVTWVPQGSEWSQLRGDLRSCDGPCGPAGVAACVNNMCVGNPVPPNTVQSAGNIGVSPLVVQISTAGNEDRVELTIKPRGPLTAAAPSQPIHFRLEHVG